MKSYSLYTDLVICGLALPLMLYLFPIERWWGLNPVFFLLFVGWLYLTYFGYKYYILPRVLMPHSRRMRGLMVMALSVIGTLVFASYPIHTPWEGHGRPRPLPPPAWNMAPPSPHDDIPDLPEWGMRLNQQAVWLYYIIVVILCFGLGMEHRASCLRMQSDRLENERNQAELALYKAQINPHFLFNTLNTIYGLLISRSEKATTALEYFIGIVRYMYQNAHREMVTLSEEIAYLRHYTELQKLRTTDVHDISFTYHTDNSAYALPPMLLTTFVENAFKYGLSADCPSFVHISLVQHGGELHFSVTNSIARSHTGNSSGKGIENCRQRLNLLYPGRFDLYTGPGDGDGVYNVSLNLHNSTP